MNTETIKKAIEEANEFIKRAKIVLEDCKQNETVLITGNRNTGALRRQSLELTRALADMRKTYRGRQNDL